MAFGVCFVILSISVEGLFYVAFSITLVLWVEVEGRLRASSLKESKDQLQPVLLFADDVRIAVFFLFFVQVAFFGTGKYALFFLVHSVCSSNSTQKLALPPYRKHLLVGTDRRQTHDMFSDHFTLNLYTVSFPYLAHSLWQPYWEVFHTMNRTWQLTCLYIQIFKTVAPYVVLSAAFATLTAKLGLPPFSLFLVAMSLTDGIFTRVFLSWGV